jgi:hypothetical protein
MSRHYPYVSGHCSADIKGHARCQGEYGAYGRTTRCTCRCHQQPATPVVNDPLDMLGEAPDVSYLEW